MNIFGNIFNKLTKANTIQTPDDRSGESSVGTVATLGKKELTQTLSDIQDRFSFLYDSFDKYRKENWESISYNDRLDLVKKYFVQDENPDRECIYRGMGLSIDTLRKIYQEGMLVNKNEDEDNEVMCFTVQDPYYSSQTIERAAQENQDQISVIFEVPLKLLKDNGMRFGGGGDKLTIDGDISANIVKKCKIFIVNYKDKDLVSILPSE